MKKNIQVSGFTKAQRLKDLEKIKTKYLKKDYKFIEYIDDGITKSIAIFEVDEKIIKKEKNKKITIAVVSLLIIVFFIFSTTKETNFLEKTNKEAQSLSLQRLENISKDYVQSKQISESYGKSFYNCLGQLIWEKDEKLTINKMLDWCYIDYEKADNHQMKQYYNTAKLMKDISPWDGSYKPFEDYIKTIMTNSNSYEHENTKINFVYYGADRPHMQVRTTFKGTNALGCVVSNSMSVKVDAITNKLYDISN